MERRARALTNFYSVDDAENVQRRADYVYWSVLPTPGSVREVEASSCAKHDLKGTSNIDAVAVPSALALTLVRRLDVPEADAAHDVAAFGVETWLTAMTLPPAHRAAFLEQAPDDRAVYRRADCQRHLVVRHG